jgi:hypothetical protein
MNLVELADHNLYLPLYKRIWLAIITKCLKNNLKVPVDRNLYNGKTE